MECHWNVHCYIIVVSSQIPTYVTNSKSIMDYCKVCRTSVANDRYRRLLQNHASCREGIAVLGCQPAVGICAEEAVGEFSCGYVCKKCFDAVIKYQAKKKAFAALEKDLLGKLSAKTMQSGEGRGVKRPRVSDSAYEYDEKPSVACAHA